MLRRICRLAAFAVWLTAAGAAPATAAPPIVLGPDGTTAPIFDYEQAVRERVYIPQPEIDQDGDGADDWIAVEIMRPQESGPGVEVPAIVDASPYYATLCRGNEGECIGDPDGDGRNDRWPLFYDNYFVPRGYAYVLAEMNGTANSTGCPLHGGPGDVAGMASVIDWLNGRGNAYATPAAGTPIHADWSSGNAAMIGKSYDGTLANGVAARGVEGLRTIVPISAISDWYGYSRMGGVRYNSDYPAFLANAVTSVPRQAACAPARSAMSAADGDETGDRTAFWDVRDYLANVGDVRAAVFATHGLQDDNVKLDQLGPWWAGLAANGVPRKLWLLRGGHVDPFDSRRGAWVDTLHRWLDHWLLGVENGIMAEPRVSIEESRDTWRDYADWPLPGAAPTQVYLRGTSQATAGELGLSAGGAVDTLTWTDAPTANEAAVMSDPETARSNRRVFLSAPLQQDLRLSGTPVVELRAALDKAQANLGAALVDYGPGTQVTRSGEGIANTAVRDCWGASTTRTGPGGAVIDHDACYLQVRKPEVAVTQWRISRGILDSANRTSLRTIEPVTPGAPTAFSWPLEPQEHVVPAGHRLGIVLLGGYPSLGIAGTTGTTFTLDAKTSRVTLPVVGGYRAAAATRAFAPDTGAPVLAGVPADRVVAAEDASGATVRYPLPTATDDETPDPEVACDPPPGARFPIGATTVTCTATDAYGNATTHAFTVTVVGPGSPAPQSPGANPIAPGGDVVPRADTAAPRLRAVTLKRLRRALRVRFRLDEAARVELVVRRKGAGRPAKVIRVRARAGRTTLRLRLAGLRAGRYTVTLRVHDAAGNAAAPQRLRFTLRR